MLCIPQHCVVVPKLTNVFHSEFLQVRFRYVYMFVLFGGNEVLYSVCVYCISIIRTPYVYITHFTFCVVFTDKLQPTFAVYTTIPYNSSCYWSTNIYPNMYGIVLKKQSLFWFHIISLDSLSFFARLQIYHQLTLLIWCNNLAVSLIIQLLVGIVRYNTCSSNRL